MAMWGGGLRRGDGGPVSSSWSKGGMNKPHQARAGVRAFIKTKNWSNHHHQPHPYQDCSRRENRPSCPRRARGGERRCFFVRGYRRGTERCCVRPRQGDPFQCPGCDGPAGALSPGRWQPWPCSPSTPFHGACVGPSELCGELPSHRTRSLKGCCRAGLSTVIPVGTNLGL